MKIYIGSDHRAFEIENKITEYLKDNGLEVIGTSKSHDENDDYPDFAFEVCENVLNNENSLGILLCGTGIGMSIAANKVKGIRAARCDSKEDAFYAKNHNAANVICLSSNIELETLFEIIDTFISTTAAFEDRHLKRIDKIIKYENGEYNG